jgi:hypothetical protein
MGAGTVDGVAVGGSHLRSTRDIEGSRNEHSDGREQRIDASKVAMYRGELEAALADPLNTAADRLRVLRDFGARAADTENAPPRESFAPLRTAALTKVSSGAFTDQD